MLNDSLLIHTVILVVVVIISIGRTEPRITIEVWIIDPNLEAFRPVCSQAVINLSGPTECNRYNWCSPGHPVWKDLSASSNISTRTRYNNSPAGAGISCYSYIGGSGHLKGTWPWCYVSISIHIWLSIKWNLFYIFSIKMVDSEHINIIEFWFNCHPHNNPPIWNQKSSTPSRKRPS